MPLFIKTERFTKETLNLLPEERNKYLAQHKYWVEKLIASGEKLSTGYLTNKERQPGGGGLLVIEAPSFAAAKEVLEQDPMIANNLVSWELQEWVPLIGKLLA